MFFFFYVQYVSESGISSLEDLQLLQEESDYSEIGLSLFEKRKLKKFISTLKKPGKMLMLTSNWAFVFTSNDWLIESRLQITDSIDNNGKEAVAQGMTSKERLGNFKNSSVYVYTCSSRSNVVFKSYQ